MRDGALLAIDEINRSRSYDFQIKPIVIDPGGALDRYYCLTQDLIGSRSVRHVIGCYTSSSRKEIIPIIEKYDALLWYPSHYEGFESCESVIYGGATPNQHLLPLARWAFRNYGPNIYCIGSNYVWSWGNNRIMRELAEAAGGRILAERYLPIGCTDVRQEVKDIVSRAPDAIFCTLIGDSSYEFFREYNKLSTRDTSFAAENRPILSCSLSEPELARIGLSAKGHLCASAYFNSIKGLKNRQFVENFRIKYGARRTTSADAEASYTIARLLAAGIHRSGTTAPTHIKEALYDHTEPAPQGPVTIQRGTNHCCLTPRIAASQDDDQFDILWESDGPVEPDPYLTRLNRDHLRLLRRESRVRDVTGSIRK